MNWWRDHKWCGTPFGRGRRHRRVGWTQAGWARGGNATGPIPIEFLALYVHYILYINIRISFYSYLLVFEEIDIDS